MCLTILEHYLLKGHGKVTINVFLCALRKNIYARSVRISGTHSVTNIAFIAIILLVVPILVIHF